jgi:hypothetical protein
MILFDAVCKSRTNRTLCFTIIPLQFIDDLSQSIHDDLDVCNKTKASTLLLLQAIRFVSNDTEERNDMKHAISSSIRQS